MMQRPDLISSPIVQSKLVDVVTALMFGPRRFVRQGKNESLAFGNDRGHAGAVMDSEQCRKSIPTALVGLYSELHAIVGLDVDNDAGFDKFQVRHRINALLVVLWKHPLPEARTALVGALAPEKAFLAFFGAALDTIVYCVFDVLDRVRDGVIIEQYNSAAGALPPPPGAAVPGTAPGEAHPRKGFYDAQQRTARGFGAIGESTFGALEAFLGEPAVSRALAAPAATTRAVSLALTLVRRVADPAAYDLAEPQAWHFDRARLLSHAVGLLAAVRAAHDAAPGGRGAADFRRACVDDAAFDAAFLFDVAATQPGGEGLAALRPVLAGAARPPDGGDRDAAVRQLLRDALAAAPAADDDDVAYEANLHPLQIAEAAGIASAPGFYYDPAKYGAAGTSHPFRRALMKEWRGLKKDSMPPHPDGGIFVHFDEARGHLARCGITGPAGTPYAHGLFVFDVYFPPSYPNDPMLVQLVTTGGGQVRFNPNLYEDGKVCLSLLGTWHAGDASEKWIAKESSLRQVLMSILAQIFVRDPYFNEPGREGQAGTPEAQIASRAKNAELRVATLRHAVLGHLRAPPPGLEDVAEEHFRRVKHRLLRRCQQDLYAAPPEWQADTRRAVADVVAALKAPQQTSEPPTKRAKADSGVA
ncbi:hypothetical protein M885DRAFT_336256 [Pelagophyceae sp. CCMP2097]|nr:hypothetical protein M885DRAFT_336256 [Pelagophyceae sp. CCMP2097]